MGGGLNIMCIRICKTCGKRTTLEYCYRIRRGKKCKKKIIRNCVLCNALKGRKSKTHSLVDDSMKITDYFETAFFYFRS